PSSVPTLLTNARMLFADGKQADALAAAKSAAQNDPHSADAQFVIGLITAAKDPDGAITAFNEALKLDPTLAAAQYELARAYLATGDATSAVIMARQAATEWPTEDTRLVFARALLAKGAGDEAQEQLASLAREFPKSATVQVLVGRLAMQRGDPAGARRAFEA